MGVWQRSPAGLRIALSNPELATPPTARALPDLRPQDVIGSPYCVRDYVVDDALRRQRAAWPPRASGSAERGLGLILDYVPNHVAPDHPWPTERPDVLSCQGASRTSPSTRRRLRARRQRDRSPTAAIPYFPPWPDVVQLNAFSPALRAAAAETLFGHRRASATECAATWRC